MSRAALACTFLSSATMNANSNCGPGRVSKNNPPQSNSFTSFSAAPSTAMDEGTILALVMRTIRMKK